VKHTGQELGGELCEIFKFWSLLQSKSVNSVCKLLQLLGLQTPTRASLLDPLGDFRPPDLQGYSPPMKILTPPMITRVYKRLHSLIAGDVVWQVCLNDHRTFTFIKLRSIIMHRWL